MSDRPTPASSVAALAGAHTTSTRTNARIPRTRVTIPAALRRGAVRESPVGAGGFEPPTSCSQSTSPNQDEPRPLATRPSPARAITVTELADDTGGQCL